MKAEKQWVSRHDPDYHPSSLIGDVALIVVGILSCAFFLVSFWIVLLDLSK